MSTSTAVVLIKHGDVSQETARLLQQIREMIPGELIDA
jgi:hypothetical protein